MPLFLTGFVSWLASTFFAIASWFITRAGIRVTAALALIALLGSAINLFISQADSFLSSVVPSVVPFVTAFIPSNTGLCLSVVVSTELIATAYKLTIKLIEFKSRVLLS